MIYDFCVIGGGIVGLSVARKLLSDRPGSSLLLLEKEKEIATHQTGHNSGVIHAGIYYTPGSLKAKLCRQGLNATKEFCRKHKIPFVECGKLIVATNEVEDRRIEDLYQRAIANGLNLQKVSGGELCELEPNITGSSALLSPETGIVDYRLVADKMAEESKDAGAEFQLEQEVVRLNELSNYVEIATKESTYRARKLIVCGGVQSDRLAQIAGLKNDFRVIPFRGEYFVLPKSKNSIVNHLIYPGPDPSLPFLGVHLTRMIDGSVTVGPNAVLGLSREGYPKFSFSMNDFQSIVGFPGFWKLIWKYRYHAMHELKGSLIKGSYLKECQKYCKELEKDDLLPYRAGIRAQVVTKDGVPVHDFLFRETDRMLHVLNAPSPAATSAIPIGEFVAEKLFARS